MDSLSPSEVSDWPALDPKDFDKAYEGLSDDLADQGFITTSVRAAANWARTGSLM
jgi:hypothetical protein